MAKTKKAEVLTLEEKLQQALVPQEEQPYKVPENWCWVNVGQLCILYRGVSYKKQDVHNEKRAQDCLILRGGNIIEGAIKTDNSDNVYINKLLVQDEQLICTHDIIIVSSTGSSKVIGRAGISYQDYSDVAFGAFLTLVRPKDNIVKPFIAYYFQSDLYRNRIRNLAAGININNIKANYIINSPIPLPPLCEQQRIVDRIESLFAKLDEAKEKAQEVVDGFEERKAAILHKAFTGELTAKWRAEHGIGMDSWEEKTLESVCNSIFDGDHMPPPKSETGVPFLVISNVNTGYLSFDNTRFVPESYFKGLSNSRKPEYGDVLYTIVGSYGIPVIVDSDKEFCFQRHIALLKPKSINSYYLWYCLQSREVFNKVTDIATGTAQLTVPIKGLRKIKINCASIDEQVEIVNIVNDMFVKEQLVKRNAESTIKKIELIKKSILAKAFRGELGTNNPEEESSIKALKECL